MILSNDYCLSVNAAIPGSSLPSNNSKKAPPPVDINDTLYDSPILWNARYRLSCRTIILDEGVDWELGGVGLSWVDREVDARELVWSIST